MLRQGDPLGVIVVGWAEPGPVAKAQEGLLKQFAEQAVIAIENVRLFDAEQRHTRELSEALEQQTATSEVLRSSPARPANWSLSSAPCWRMRSASATPILARCSASTASFAPAAATRHAAGLSRIPKAARARFGRCREASRTRLCGQGRSPTAPTALLKRTRSRG